MTISFAPFATYAVTGVVSAAAQTEINLQIDNFLALLPNSATGGHAAHPDFDCITADVEQKIRAEIAALKTAIDAAPII